MPSAVRLPLLLTCAGLWLLTGCARMGLVGETSRPPEVTQAQVALAQGDEKRARARFDAYLRADPTDPMRYLWVAEACSAPPTRRNNLAIEYLQRGLAATPRAAPDLRAQLYTQIGAAWDALGEYDRSLEAYKVAYKLTPDSPLAMNNLGYGYAQMPEGSVDLNEALKLTTHAVTLSRERGASDAELGVFRDSLGWVQYKMRAYDEAITTLGDAVSLVASAEGPRPDLAVVSYHLAMVYRARNRLRDARPLLERAVQMDPDNAAARRELAEVKAALLARPPQPGPPAPPGGAGDGAVMRSAP